jgi:hypothetical protein
MLFVNLEDLIVTHSAVSAITRFVVFARVLMRFYVGTPYILAKNSVSSVPPSRFRDSNLIRPGRIVSVTKLSAI